MIYLKLAFSFLKVGLFGIGGGYAMLPLIQHEVVSLHPWLSSEEFVDVVAIAQMTPGPIAVNVSTSAGYKIKGLLGSVVSTGSNVVPTFLLVLVASGLFFKFKESRQVADFLKGFRPVVIGLIAAADILMAKASFADYKSPLIFLGVLVCGYRFRVHPILLIVLSALLGILLY